MNMEKQIIVAAHGAKVQDSINNEKKTTIGRFIEKYFSNNEQKILYIINTILFLLKNLILTIIN